MHLNNIQVHLNKPEYHQNTINAIIIYTLIIGLVIYFRPNIFVNPEDYGF